MATAKKLPSGSWRVQLYAGKTPDGKRRYLSFTANTKKEAEYQALQYQLHYKEVNRDPTSMTLDEAMEKYISSKDGILSPSTIRGYENIRRNNLKGLMPLALNRITQPMVQEATMKDNLPRYTLRINRITLDKLEYIAKFNGRSKNREIEWLIRRHIADFEKEHGRIDLSGKDGT